MKMFLWINLILCCSFSCQSTQGITNENTYTLIKVSTAAPFMGGMPRKGQNKVIQPASNKVFKLVYLDGSQEILTSDEQGFLKTNSTKTAKELFMHPKELKYEAFEKKVTEDYLKQDSSAQLIHETCLKEQYLSPDYTFTSKQDSIGININRFGYTFYCFKTKAPLMRP